MTSCCLRGLRFEVVAADSLHVFPKIVRVWKETASRWS